MAVKLIASIVGLLLIRAVFKAFEKFNEKEVLNAPLNQVRLPKYYAWMGIVAVLFFLAIIIWSTVITGEFNILFTFFIGLFIVMGLMLITAYLNWRIDFDDSGFRIRTFFRRWHSFGYDEVKRIKFARDTIYLFTEKKIFWMEYKAIGID